MGSKEQKIHRDKPFLKIVMCTITCRHTCRFFTATEPYRLFSFSHILRWRYPCSFMRTVTEGLRIAFSAGAPPIFVPFLHINSTGFFLSNYRFCHLCSFHITKAASLETTTSTLGFYKPNSSGGVEFSQAKQHITSIFKRRSVSAECQNES